MYCRQYWRGKKSCWPGAAEVSILLCCRGATEIVMFKPMLLSPFFTFSRGWFVGGNRRGTDEMVVLLWDPNNVSWLQLSIEGRLRFCCCCTATLVRWLHHLSPSTWPTQAVNHYDDDDDHDRDRHYSFVPKEPWKDEGCVDWVKTSQKGLIYVFWKIF